jgi:cytochrome c-type biogenesis protein CcmH/NrfG
MKSTGGCSRPSWCPESKVLYQIRALSVGAGFSRRGRRKAPVSPRKMPLRGTRRLKPASRSPREFVNELVIQDTPLLTGAHSGMIEVMRVQALTFLLVGFAVGFAGIYTWTKQRAPAVVRATPLPVDPNVPTDLSAANNPSEPPPPPVDMARVKELTSKIKENPKDFDSIVELANINFDQRNYDDAINLYKKAVEIRPDALNVRTDMGTAMFFQKRYDDAIATFKETLQTNPNDAQTLFNLGVAMLHGKNDPQRALEYWEKLIETNPNHPQAAFVKEQIKKLKEQQAKP